MYTYGVSFTIEHDNEWSDRYTSLMTEIKRCPRVWLETTSFCLVATSEQLADFERRLFLSKLSPSKDKLLVVHLDFVHAIARGKIEMPATLRLLLPRIIIK